MKNNYGKYRVSFWSHDHGHWPKLLNDCVGNSLDEIVTARNPNEAIRKVQKGKTFFRLRFIEQSLDKRS